MENEKSGDRLRSRLNEMGLTPSWLAGILGISNQTVNNWFVRGVPAGKVMTVAVHLAVRHDWLRYGQEPKQGAMDAEIARLRKAKGDSETGPISNAEMLGPFDVWDDDTPLDDDEVYVPFLKEVELSAGSGRTTVQQSERRKLRFGKLTLRRQNVQPSEAVCVTVSGNSMEPVLPDGSTVGVDQGATAVVDGKMYAINHGGQLRVKTLYRLPGGGVRMRSFNRDEHPDEEYSPQEMIDKEILVLGKVFWSSVLW